MAIRHIPEGHQYQWILACTSLCLICFNSAQHLQLTEVWRYCGRLLRAAVCQRAVLFIDIPEMPVKILKEHIG